MKIRIILSIVSFFSFAQKPLWAEVRIDSVSQLFRPSPRGGNGVAVEVTYKDYEFNKKNATITVPLGYENQVVSLFKSLFAHNFSIAKLNPLENYKDVEHALSDNDTFLFLNIRNKLVLFVNPSTNPMLYKPIGSSRLRVFPTQGILSVNRESQLLSRGVVNDETRGYFEEVGFYPFIFLENEASQLFFGVFSTEIPPKSPPPIHQEKKRKQPLVNSHFYHRSLNKQETTFLLKHKIWKKGCPLPLRRLEVIYFDYHRFNDDSVKQGNVAAIDTSAPYLVEALKSIYLLDFPLRGANFFHSAAGEIQDVSGFFCRSITGDPSNDSLHAYGSAIDIGINANPFFGSFKKDENSLSATTEVVPSTLSLKYLSRKEKGSTELVVPIMKRAGFTEWGGFWDTPVDFMHFQLPPFVAKLISSIDAQEAKKIYLLYLNQPEALEQFKDPSIWISLYEAYGSRAITLFIRDITKIKTLPEKKLLIQIYRELQSSP